MSKQNSANGAAPSQDGEATLSSASIGLPAPATEHDLISGAQQAEAITEKSKTREVEALATRSEMPTTKAVTIDDLKRDPILKAFIRRANEQLKLIGYTEHGERHASLVANIAHNILQRLGRPERQTDLAA